MQNAVENLCSKFHTLWREKTQRRLTECNLSATPKICKTSNYCAVDMLTWIGIISLFNRLYRFRVTNLLSTCLTLK